MSMSKMPAHTPGPWEVLDGAVLSKGMNDYGNWIVCGINRDRTEQDEANLRLIAAAPALLEALERIASHEYRADRRHRGMIDVEEIETLRRTARAAIAQAKGETANG